MCKDRTIRSGVETNLDAKMSEETAIEKVNGAVNDWIDATWSSTQGLEEVSYNMKKKRTSAIFTAM